MKFEKFIQALDIGECQDQQQRQALFDLVLFLIVADGVISEQERSFIQQWLESISWTSAMTKEQYYENVLLKCYAAIKTNTVDDFLHHRAKLLIDKDMKLQAMKLVRDVAMADGDLDPSEHHAIEVLSAALEQ
jgi:uncharacterized tellurite resistance protein B-like protein